MSNQAYLTSKNENFKKRNIDKQMKVSANYHAELHGFNSNSGDETYDWMAAKAEIDHLLQNSKQASELLKKSEEVSNHWSRTRAQRKTK